MTKRKDQHRFQLRLEEEFFQRIRHLAFERKESIQSLMEHLVCVGFAYTCRVYILKDSESRETPEGEKVVETFKEKFLYKPIFVDENVRS